MSYRTGNPALDRHLESVSDRIRALERGDQWAHGTLTAKALRANGIVLQHGLAGAQITNVDNGDQFHLYKYEKTYTVDGWLSQSSSMAIKPPAGSHLSYVDIIIGGYASVPTPLPTIIVMYKEKMAVGNELLTARIQWGVHEVTEQPNTPSSGAVSNDFDGGTQLWTTITQVVADSVTHLTMQAYFV